MFCEKYETINNQPRKRNTIICLRIMYTLDHTCIS